MEHRLVQGGEQYLPFARSRIKALRALGLAYADQRFDLGDAHVRVSIEPGHEYISLSGGCTQKMDSGIVDVLIGQLRGISTESGLRHPKYYLPGIMRGSFASDAYHAAFSETTSTASARKKNPGTTNAGQIAGELSFSGRMRGSTPADSSTRTFSPALLENVTVSPPVWGDDPKDEILARHKDHTTTCPPSMFTGRCRNWVQAMYGLYLYDNPRNAKSTLPYSTVLYDGAPYLNVTPIMVPGDEAANKTVVVTTSTGIHLDKETGEHWMFYPHVGGVDVFPMKASPCAEKLRRYLRVPLPNDAAGLTQTDIDHIEAFVLSSSLPHRGREKLNQGSIDLGGGVSHYSMGYGWHWNLTGLDADIVVNSTVHQPDSPYEDVQCMRSTHFRLTMSKIGVGDNVSWSVSQATVSGPSFWSVNRGVVCIAEPAWATEVAPNHLSKLLPYQNPNRITFFNCLATFYAFYIGDELQICTARNTETPAVPVSHTCSPPGYNIIYTDSSGDSQVLEAFITTGLLGGESETKNLQPAYYRSTIICGGERVSIKVGGSLQGHFSKMDTKVMEPIPTQSESSWVQGYQMDNYDSGYPDANGSYAVTYLEHIDPELTPGRGRTALSVGAIDVDITLTMALFSEYYPSGAEIIVPVHDAEAIYLSARESVVRTESNRQIGVARVPGGLPLGQFVSALKIREYTGGNYFESPWLYKYYKQPFSGGESISTDTPPPTTTDVKLFDTKNLLCRAGSVQINEEWSLSEAFHTINDSEIYESFRTVTSAAPDGKAAVIGDHISSVGTGSMFDEPVMVGWV